MIHHFKHTKHKWSLLAILLLFFVYIPQSNAETARKDGLTFVELFTTQGCPSCPKADRIFERIVHEIPDRVIALSCHVTYFDTDAWKDTLSTNICDARHAEYFKSLDLSAIYTPQMIINGKFDTKGNDLDTVRKGIQMGLSFNAMQDINLKIEEGYLDITLPSIILKRPADIWLMTYKDAQRVIISNGRNRGQVLNYLHSVNRIMKLMRWNGNKINMAFPLQNLDADGYVVVVQKQDHTDILAAGEARPNKRPTFY